MSYKAARQVEPEVARVESGDGYQLLPDPANQQLDNGRYKKLRNCQIIQGILITVLVAAVLVLVVSVGVVSTKISPAERSHSLSCYQETDSCSFSAQTVDGEQINSPCTAITLSTNAKVHMLVSKRYRITITYIGSIANTYTST